MLKAGDRIGDWIVDRPLGEGGMGAVFRVHSALSEKVEAALKVMKPSLEADARQRFVREAEALSALRHPAIVRVMGFSEDPRRGLLYLVMELAEGETLKRRLERGAMALPEVLATFLPLAAGLEHAHAAGISHRDLKPSNVILTSDGVRLVDFGIAAAAQSSELTGAGHLGTLSYLPPEVFRGERPEPRLIDVYGFGLLLNEALTGQHPFPVEPGLTPAAAAATVGMRKLQHPALDPGEQAPPPVRDLVKRATDPDPRARPAMADIRRTLESLVERRAVVAAPATAATPVTPARVTAWTPPADATMRVPDPVMAAPPGERTTTRVRRRWRERRRSVIVAWGASMVAAALLAALVIIMVGQRRAAPAGQGVTPEASPSPLATATPSARRPAARLTTTTVPLPAEAPPSPVAAPPPAVDSAAATPVRAAPSERPSPRPSVRPSPSPSPSPSVHPSPSPSAAVRPSPSASVHASPSPAAPAAAPRPRPPVVPATTPAPPPAEPESEPSPSPSPSPPGGLLASQA